MGAARGSPMRRGLKCIKGIEGVFGARAARGSPMRRGLKSSRSRPPGVVHVKPRAAPR